MADKPIRGRLAFSMPDIAFTEPPTQADMTWHVGHARSLHLASLICQNLGIPLDIRLQGSRYLYDSPPHVDTNPKGDISGAVVDMANCINFIGPKFRRLYWQAQCPPLEWKVRAELGERTEAFLNAADAHGNESAIATRCDDIIENYPSLAIRGREWLETEVWVDAPHIAAGTGSLVKVEKILYHLAGRTAHEKNLPLITIGGHKLAKSEGRMVHWGILTCVAPAVARQFLLATAIRPADPLAIMDEELSIDQIVLDPYEWSWSDWTGLIRRQDQQQALGQQAERQA